MLGRVAWLRKSSSDFRLRLASRPCRRPAFTICAAFDPSLDTLQSMRNFSRGMKLFQLFQGNEIVPTSLGIQYCKKAKEIVVRETVYGSKKNKKSKAHDKNKSNLSKRDEIDFGYEAIDIKSDLKYAKIGTSAYTECQDAIFQSESEESNKNVLRTSK